MTICSGSLRKHNFKSIVIHDLASELFCCYIMSKLVCAVWNFRFCSRPVQRWGQQWGRPLEHPGTLALIDLHKGSWGHTALCCGAIHGGVRDTPQRCNTQLHIHIKKKKVAGGESESKTMNVTFLFLDTQIRRTCRIKF